MHGGDPLVYNEGDQDLEKHLAPLLNKAGGDIRALEMESLRRALTDGTLMVCGVKLWNTLHSEAWRHREAAAQAYSEFLLDKLPSRYDNETTELFKATADIAKVACNDKLL